MENINPNASNPKNNFPNNKKSSLARNIITFVIFLASVYFAFRGIDFRLLWNYIISANYFYIVLPLPIMIYSHWLRAVRWKTFLLPINNNVKTRNLFASVMIGYAINNILPRGGEIVRPYVLAKQENMSFSSTFATIVLERLLDVFTLLLLFAITFFVHSEKIIMLLPNNIDFVKVTYLLILIFVLIVFSFYPPITNYLLNKLIKPFSNNFYLRIHDIFEKFRLGFAVIRNPRLYAKIIIESLLIWFFYSLPLYIMFYAFDFSSQGMSFTDAILLLVASGISFSIAPTPGSIGVFHWIVKIILVKFYGVSGEQALAYATVNHGVNYLLQIFLGGYFIVKDKTWDTMWNKPSNK